MNEDFHIIYRPQRLDEVIGQERVVDSLKNFKASGKWPHAYLFVGPSGTGKTTLGRIIANELETTNVIELDAASNSSVEGVRNLTSGLNYQGFGKDAKRVIILDEVHSFSKQAWQALLKPLEEPPAHVYFVLCTTETGKVPKTIVTRCQEFNLKPVPYDQIAELVEFVAEDQKIKFTEKMVNLIAQESQGSPRRALTLLSKASACDNIDELREILETADENKDVADLCRYLCGKEPLTWKKLMGIVTKFEDPRPESIRIVVTNWASKVLTNASDEKQILRLLSVLDAFSEPFRESDKLGPLLIALGQLTYE